MLPAIWGGGGGGGGGNFGTDVGVSILKPTPIIYLAFEKNSLFIYLISQKDDQIIYCSLNLYTFHILCNCVCMWGEGRDSG